MEEFDTNLLHWLVGMVSAINSAKPVLSLEYGYYELGDIPITFENEGTRFLIGPSEFSDSFVIKYKRDD
jgi:hypothetical protein